MKRNFSFIMDKKGVFIDPFIRRFSMEVEKLLKKRKQNVMRYGCKIK